MKKLAFISLAAIMASFAASADTIVTSKTYVDSKDNLKQNAITAGAANSVALYTGTTTTNGGADFTSRNLYSDTTASNYVANTHSTYIPTMGAVMAQITSSVPSGTANNVATYDAQGKLSATGRGVYSDASSYTAANDADKLVAASALNTVKTAVDTLQNCTHTCASSDPTNAPNACDLITINCVQTASQGN